MGAVVSFKNKDVADKFETTQTVDKIHHLPGGKNGNGWKGLLSEIPLEQAERWVDRPGQNLLVRKQPAKTEKSNRAQEPKE